jgi:hypothetical protein
LLIVSNVERCPEGLDFGAELGHLILQLRDGLAMNMLLAADDRQAKRIQPLDNPRQSTNEVGVEVALLGGNGVYIDSNLLMNAVTDNHPNLSNDRGSPANVVGDGNATADRSRLT